MASVAHSLGNVRAFPQRKHTPYKFTSAHGPVVNPAHASRAAGSMVEVFMIAP